jgi:hypothetical protein
MRKILLLSLLAGLAWFVPKNSKAQAPWPAAAGDTLFLDVNALDSLGQPVSVESLWCYTWYYTTGTARVLGDSARFATAATIISGATDGDFRVSGRQGADSTITVASVGKTSKGLWVISAKVWTKAVKGSLSANWSRTYAVGALSTTTYLAAADDQRLLGTAYATPSIGGVPEVDATHWLGQQIPTANTPGVPVTDVEFLQGTAPAVRTVGYFPAEVELHKGKDARNIYSNIGADTFPHTQPYGIQQGGTARFPMLVDAQGSSQIASADSLAFVDSTAKAPRTHTSVTTVTGNVNGSVGSVTGAVGSVTAEVRVNSAESLRYVMAVDTARAAVLANVATHGGSAFVLTGDRLIFTATTGAAWRITGNGVNPGFWITGGATNANGLYAEATGSGAGGSFLGGLTGPGLVAGGGATSGDGFRGTSNGVGNYGFSGTFDPRLGKLASDSTWLTNFAQLHARKDNGDIIDSADGWGQTGAGGGSSCTFGTTYTDTIYFRNTTSSTNIANAIATIKNASQATLGKIQADANGRYVGTFDATTYLIYPHFLNGIAWTDNPDTFVVTGNGQNDTVRGTTISLPAPPLGGQITVGANIFDLLGDSIAGATVEFSLNQNAYFSTDDTTNMVLVAKTERSRQTDVSGAWSINLYPTSKMMGGNRKEGVYYICKIYLPDGITTLESSRPITFDNSSCCVTFQYRNYGPWRSE